MNINTFLLSEQREFLKHILKSETPDNPIIIVGSLGLMIHGVLNRLATDIDILTKKPIKIKNSNLDIENQDYASGVFDNITKRNKITFDRNESACNFISDKDIDSNDYEEKTIFFDDEYYKVKVQRIDLILKYKKAVSLKCGKYKTYSHNTDILLIEQYLQRKEFLKTIL